MNVPVGTSKARFQATYALIVNKFEGKVYLSKEFPHIKPAYLIFPNDIKGLLVPTT